MAGLARELKDWSRKQREMNADASIGIMDDEMYDLCLRRSYSMGVESDMHFYV